MTIERAAKAIADRNCYPHMARALKDEFHEDARAALDAIAEPTPEMIEAGRQYYVGAPTDTVMTLIWRAMHAAMMEERK